MKVTNEMVDRFLSWALPKDFAPDCGINFDGRKDDEFNKNKQWPIGTNLFTATQAREMLEHALGAPTAVYWLIERNQRHGEPSARWYSETRHFAQGSQDLWVQDVTRAMRFATKALADEFIDDDRFTDPDVYPVRPDATEHKDL